MKRCFYIILLGMMGFLIVYVISVNIFGYLDRTTFNPFSHYVWKYPKYTDNENGSNTSLVLNHQKAVNRYTADVITEADVFNETNAAVNLDKTSPNRNKTVEIKILQWTNCFGHACFQKNAFQNCESKCQFTTDKSQLKLAHIVFFHTCKLSDLVEAGVPQYRSHNQRWIFRCMEAPAIKWFGFPELEDAFNFTMTIRLDSDFHVYHGVYVKNPSPPRVLPDYAKGKSKLAAWIVSNCKTLRSRREIYVQRLQEHIPVDIYGKCGKECPQANNKYACFNFVGATYKFYLAFENSDCRDYVTEKVWRNAILKNTVPVVRGFLNNFETILPPGSYIHTNDFENPEALAKYLKYLDKNDTAYNEYFSWKFKYMQDKARRKDCDLCKTLHETEGQVKTYKNIWNDFYSFKNNCYNYTGITIKDFDK